MLLFTFLTRLTVLRCLKLRLDPSYDRYHRSTSDNYSEWSVFRLTAQKISNHAEKIIKYFVTSLRLKQAQQVDRDAFLWVLLNIAQKQLAR